MYFFPKGEELNFTVKALLFRLLAGELIITETEPYDQFYYFGVSDRLSTGIAVADIDFSLIDSARTKMPISQVIT